MGGVSMGLGYLEGRLQWFHIWWVLDGGHGLDHRISEAAEPTVEGLGLAYGFQTQLSFSFSSCKMGTIMMPTSGVD